MTELRQAREVDMVPEELRYVPQVKSDIIIQRRNVSLAPIEAANVYTREGTNTITFNIQGHRELSQLLDTKSMYFTWHVAFKNAYPVEDVAMLIEEVIISSNGRVIERIRHAQYIQHFVRGYGLSRKSKARLGKRAGFQSVEDRTIQTLADYANSKFGTRKSVTTATAPFVHPLPQANGGAPDNVVNGATGYNDFVDDTSWELYSRMSDNLGYEKFQINRENAAVALNNGHWGAGCSIPRPGAANRDQFGKYALMKFRLHCSGLLSSDKMLPIGFMPLTIQLRLSDQARATDSLPANLGPAIPNPVAAGGGYAFPGAKFDYQITRPRLHMNVCSVGQAYASAMLQRLRGPGITLNCKMFDTFFQIITSDKQIVIPSNKQRLSKVWVFFHKNGADTASDENAFRSSVTGAHCHQGIRPRPGDGGAASNGTQCLRSYQFQVGTEVSEAVTLEQSNGDLVPSSNTVENVNTGMAYLEAYLRAIGAVNGHEQDTEFWGRDLDPRCNAWEGGDLLQTFLSKYFVAVYDGEKLLGSQVETGVDTESGKDIVVDLRWANSTNRNTRVMVLIQYHAQVVMKENDVQLSY